MSSRNIPKELEICDSKLKSIISSISTIWDWNVEPGSKWSYWYPLLTTKRDDVIAYDTAKIEEDSEIEISLIFSFNKFFKGKSVYFLTELDGAKEYLSYDADVEWWSEAILIDSKLKNIVYWSHESTIAFGGNDLIDCIKENVGGIDAFTNTWHKT